MEQFSLEEYLKNPSRALVTRDGYPARIICTDALNSHQSPIIAQVWGEDGYEDTINYDRQGRLYNNKPSELDLFFAPESKENNKNILEQIRIPEGISDKLKGKTIAKTSFYVDTDDSDENHLVITFTDGTYIAVVIEYDAVDGGYFLYEHIPDSSWYDADALGYVSGEEFHYHKYFKQLIDIGVFEPIDKNILKEKILKKKKNDELREYEYYEKLKKKFENYNPNEKYGVE